MSRVLTFKEYLGGADSVISVEMFPRSKKTYTYNFNADVTGYTFSCDYQSILLDNVTYDRTTGLPNFADTVVLGYFNNYTASPTINPPIVVTPVAGIVTFTIPDNRYIGNIYPNARANVVATVMSMEWTTSTGDKNSHRYLILERWEPGVPMGDPTASGTPTYTALA